MSDAYVVDASVAIAWVHPAQATAQTDQLLLEIYDGAEIEVPAIWPLEISNALIVLVRRKKLQESERQAALNALQKLSVKVDHEMATIAFTKLSTVAMKENLSVYDAAYFELAQRRKLPLACQDGPLRAAAKRAGIKVTIAT
jgi:predicted nucleic acid-binding protein